MEGRQWVGCRKLVLEGRECSGQLLVHTIMSMLALEKFAVHFTSCTFCRRMPRPQSERFSVAGAPL